MRTATTKTRPTAAEFRRAIERAIAPALANVDDKVSALTKHAVDALCATYAAGGITEARRTHRKIAGLLGVNTNGRQAAKKEARR